MLLFIIYTALMLINPGAISSPVESLFETFDDDWDFKISPHSIPLLKDPIKRHVLPPGNQINEERAVESPPKITVRAPKKIGDAVRSVVPCSACKLGVGLLMKEIKKGTTFQDIKTKFVNLCVAFQIESENVCSGIFDVYGPEVAPVFNLTELGPQEICALVLGESCGDVENPLHEWEVELPEVIKPEVEEPILPEDGLPTFKVLHLSDTHFDPEYEEGSPANCGEPLCCRSYSTPKGNIEPAGKWGSYSKCDSPKSLIVNMLKNIAEQHPDIDYIIWTGDLPPHDIWNQSKIGNLDIIKETVREMLDFFPNTPIFPALGNHESNPAGNFAPPWNKDKNHSTEWLYTTVADQWRQWLPATAGNTVLHGGFYSVLLREGFRLISINTNYCHTLSWWLILNSTDPAKELKWLVHELQQAEDKGEKVHIIGHIPPGASDCMKVWSRNFYKIVERYENTIKGQFYGHTHGDEFEVFYDTREYSKPKKIGFRWRLKNWLLKVKNKFPKFSGRATNVAYLGPSVSTFENFNPSYRIYYIDGDHVNSTREVLDHETWTFNLEEANKSGSDPKWYRLYSVKNAYNMNSLRPKEWAKLINRLIEDPQLFDKFYKFYYRDSPLRPACSDSKCKLQMICDLRSGKSQERHHLCHDLEISFGTF